MTRWLLAFPPLVLLQFGCGACTGPAPESPVGGEPAAGVAVPVKPPPERAEPQVREEAPRPASGPTAAVAPGSAPPEPTVRRPAPAAAEAPRASPPPSPPRRAPETVVPVVAEAADGARSEATAVEALPAEEFAEAFPDEAFPPFPPRSEEVPSREPAVVIPPSPPRPGEMSSPPPVRWAAGGDPAEPATAERREFLVPEGTVIEIRLAENLSTERNRSGDPFRAILERDIELDGEVLFARGAPVQGRITESLEPGRVKGRALLSLSLVRIPADEEASYALSTNAITLEAEGTAGRDAKKVGAATAVGTALGAILGGRRGAAVGGAAGAGAGAGEVLLTRGRHVELTRERLFSFRLERDLVVELDR